jgi:uncharacterized membrane protein
MKCYLPSRTIKALFLVAMSLSSAALAEVTISGPRHLELEPGSTHTAEYTLANSGDEAVQATVFFNDYAQMPDGSLVHVPAKSLPQSLFNIASFDRLEYTLPPQSSRVVPLRITVPEDALGGYWGVVGVETPPPPTPEGQNTLGLHVRYAMVTALDITGQAQSEVRIDNLAATTTEAGAAAVSLTITNVGNLYERFELTLTFESTSGESHVATHSSVALPGQSIDLVLPVPAELPAGNYAVFATLSYRDGAQAEAVGTVEVAH